MKQKTCLRLDILVLILPFLIITACSKQQNWSQFRGPESNMLPASKNLPEEWGTNKNVKWTYNLDGTGWSSPVVWGNKVIIASTFPEKVNPVPERRPMQGPPPEGGQGGPQPGQMPPPAGGQRPQPDQQGQNPPQGPRPEVIDTSYMNEIYRWQVTCVDLNTGKELWKQIAFHGSPKAGKNPNSTYACETPVTDGTRIYAFFGMHGLYCYDMGGKLLWQKDLGSYKTQNGWGTGSSPVLYKDALYIQFDNEENSFLVAINSATGEEKWRAPREEKTTYSTPYIWKNKVRTELVTCGKIARSYDPETGKLLWKFKAGGEQVIPSPVGDKEHLYLGNAGGREVKATLFAVKAGVEGNITPAEGELKSTGIDWILSDPGLGNGSPLLYEGLIYLIGSKGEINVIDAATGEKVYDKRINGIGACWASPWAFNGKIWFLDENGVTRVFKAGKEFELLPENKLDGKFWASVAITGDDYIFRGVDKLYCVGK
jgi:outer membrane protein assembly factor BamB